MHTHVIVCDDADGKKHADRDGSMEVFMGPHDVMIGFAMDMQDKNADATYTVISDAEARQLYLRGEG